jgi:peptidoglycan/xylan/chitin deacetylase (PgdA/CDA1 family)
LFGQYVTTDEKAFSSELYMSEDQLKCMLRNCMVIGSHGYDHLWLSSLPKEVQFNEINRSVDFLKGLDVDMNTLSIGYPYGDYNEDTIDVIKSFGFKVGYTTRVNIANANMSSLDDCLKIPRLDTNDFPKERNATPNDWYYKA